MDILDQFQELKYKDLLDFVDCKQEENLYLEFKTINKSDLSNADDKKNFAKALSGFANSDGGLLIWGIKAHKNNEGIDCAMNLKPIDNPALFLTKLNEFTGQFVTPIVDNVQHKVIKIDNSEDGFVITFIPPSDSGPHMAKAKENKYYKRSGDSFYLLEHYDIEDMFGRRKKPKLELVTKIKLGHSAGEGLIVVKIIIGIKNTGRAIAKFPYLEFSLNEPFKMSRYGVDGKQHFGLPIVMHSDKMGKYIFGGNVSSVIHIQTILEVTSIYLKINLKTKEVYPKSKTDNECVIKMDYILSAEEMEIIKSSLIIKEKNILKELF